MFVDVRRKNSSSIHLKKWKKKNDHKNLNQKKRVETRTA
jgi:hypothetical protein